MRSSGVLLLSTLMVGSLSRPQQDQSNYEYEMDLQGGREIMDVENVSWTWRRSPAKTWRLHLGPYMKMGNQFNLWLIFLITWFHGMKVQT